MYSDMSTNVLRNEYNARANSRASSPTVVAGRRIMASLDAIPDGAVLVTEETLAAAIQRAWPYRPRTASGLALSAASILAALRAEP